MNYEMSKILKQILDKLCVPKNWCGYWYLVDSVLMWQQAVYLPKEIKTIIYANIAKKYNVTVLQVQKNIGNALLHCDREEMKSLFGRTLSNSQFIPACAEIIGEIAAKQRFEV